MGAVELTQEATALLDRIGSVDALHVLRLLRSGGSIWTARMVAKALDLPRDIAAESLRTLHAAEVVVAGATDDELAYVFRPRDRALTQTCTALIALYDDDPLMVLRVLNGNALQRARSAAIHVFRNPGDRSDD